MPEASDQYSLTAAREYWKYAPSGLGKINSEELLRLDDDAFLEAWRGHYRSRLTHYPEERHFTNLLREQLAGKRVLSFGSGLGLNEARLLEIGALLTCADIVGSNLDVIRRAGDLEGWSDRLSVRLLTNPPHDDVGGPYDCVYVWGSLMTMPWESQREVMRRFVGALADGGRIVLLLYTKTFMEETCGVDSPIEFARASDPSVGELHNPWSDWHDDEKLLDLAGPDAVITNRQLWNQDFYVTYAVARRSDTPTVSTSAAAAFFEFETEVARSSARLWTFEPTTVETLEATTSIRPDGAVEIATGHNRFDYAVASSIRGCDPTLFEEYTLSVTTTLREGAFSIGVLDAERNVFTYSRNVSLRGRHPHHFAWPRELMPRWFRIVVSNHRDDPGKSKFILHDVTLRGTPGADDADAGKPVDPSLFFAIERQYAPEALWSVDLADMRPVEASAAVRTDGSLHVVTGRNEGLYALASETRDGAPGPHDEMGLAVDATLERGAFTIGILDADRDAFADSWIVESRGRSAHRFTWPAERTPARFQVVVSNHSPAKESSVFALHEVTLIGRRTPFPDAPGLADRAWPSA